MPKLVPIPFSTIPKGLKELILDKSGPKENIQLLKTNQFLRRKVLLNGLFGKRADKVIFDFDEDSETFTATVTKIESSHEFDLLQQNSFSISLLQNVTSVQDLCLTGNFHDTKTEIYELDRLLKVFLRKVNLVNDLFIEKVTPNCLNEICEGFGFKVTGWAHFYTPEFGVLGIADSFIHFIETGLRFCNKISFSTFSVDPLCEELLHALLKTQVQFIEICALYGSPECCPEWIMKNGLPSENENCSILISFLFYLGVENDRGMEAFAASLLWKSVEDVELCREMELELRERIEGEIDDLISVNCFQKSGCVDDLRFLVAREPSTGRLEGEFEMLHCFVRRLK